MKKQAWRDTVSSRNVAFMAKVKSTLTSVTLALAALASSVFAATIPDGMQWGVTFGFYATNGYFGSGSRTGCSGA